MELDDFLSDAHRSLAAVLGDYYWDWAEAERHFQRAIQLAPNDVTTLQFYSFYLAYTGRPADGLPIAERAASLDPVSPSAQLNLGVVLYIGRQADQAIQQLEQTLDLDEHLGFAHAMLGLAYASKRMPERAVAELQKARASAGKRPDIVAVHGYTLGRAGRRAEALATLDDIRRLTNPQSPPPFKIALIYVGLEDWDRAFEWLAMAIEARAWEMPMLRPIPPSTAFAWIPDSRNCSRAFVCLSDGGWICARQLAWGYQAGAASRLVVSSSHKSGPPTVIHLPTHRGWIAEARPDGQMADTAGRLERFSSGLVL